MAKSIRSKIKRKHRAEFRKTIGTEAYNANMAKTQAKMKECIEQQQLNSLERLSKTLDTDAAEETTKKGSMDVNTSSPTPAESANPTTDSTGAVKPGYRGENKAMINRKMSRRTKHILLGKNKKRKSGDFKKERPKPKYFCQF
mmetsp:Transcript_3359/g.7020  ORF Transcript_3359/g.7020 Transcript_3359/m.7020 type:complete len:143 (-) Transcript_3359:161-589(-)